MKIINLNIEACFPFSKLTDLGVNYISCINTEPHFHDCPFWCGS